MDENGERGGFGGEGGMREGEGGGEWRWGMKEIVV